MLVSECLILCQMIKHGNLKQPIFLGFIIISKTSISLYVREKLALHLVEFSTSIPSYFQGMNPIPSTHI
jgi:hypothetical protein